MNVRYRRNKKDHYIQERSTMLEFAGQHHQDVKDIFLLFTGLIIRRMLCVTITYPKLEVAGCQQQMWSRSRCCPHHHYHHHLTRLGLTNALLLCINIVIRSLCN